MCEGCVLMLVQGDWGGSIYQRHLQALYHKVTLHVLIMKELQKMVSRAVPLQAKHFLFPSIAVWDIGWPKLSHWNCFNVTTNNDIACLSVLTSFLTGCVHVPCTMPPYALGLWTSSITYCIRGLMLRNESHTLTPPSSQQYVLVHTLTPPPLYSSSMYC